MSAKLLNTGIICFFIFMLLFPVFIEAVYAQSTIHAWGASEFTNADSLRFRYTDIDPSNFPRIRSLVTITNNAGFIIGHLDEDNFFVHEDGVRELPIQVIELSSQDIGINVVLTLDRSGSMQGQPIEDAKNAASIFVDLMQSRDQSAVVSFANYPRTDYPFSADKDSLKAAISTLQAEGKTAMFDACMHSADLLRGVITNRTIILLTDGADNISQYTYEEVLLELIPLEVQVFTIGLGLNHNSPEENILIDLADQTGGGYYYSPTSSDLEEIYRAISLLLHHRYEISYTTHNPARDSTLRHVRIDVEVLNSSRCDTASYRAPGHSVPVDPPPEETTLEVIPNPFTPNSDGFNDRTEFRVKNGMPADWSVTIMGRSGRKIKQLTNGTNYWDGRDNTGKLALPGSYLYIVTSANKVLYRGMIQLIR